MYTNGLAYRPIVQTPQYNWVRPNIYSLHNALCTRSPEHSSKGVAYRTKGSMVCVKDRQHNVYTIKQDKEYVCCT